MRKTIITKFGQKAIDKAKARLCSHCRFRASNACKTLLPLTTAGEDCPYFIKESK